MALNCRADAGVSYSSRNDAVDNVKLDIFNSGTFRAEDTSDVTVTVFPAAQDAAKVNSFPR